MKVTKEQITIGTRNVQTLWSTGKLELLCREMEPYNCDILGLAEMRWTGSAEINGGEIIWSGEEKKKTQNGWAYCLAEEHNKPCSAIMQ